METTPEQSGQGAMATARRAVQLVRGLRREERGDATGYLWIAPAILLYLVFNAYPIVRGLVMSTQHYLWTDPSHIYFNGLTNFRLMLDDPQFKDSFVISLKLTALTLPFSLILAMTCAVFISRVGQRSAALYRVIVFLPAVLPVAVSMKTWNMLYDNDFGYLNYTLSNLGLNPPDWLQDERWVLPAFAAALIWEGFGYSTLLFLIGIYNINQELLEAASVDGANAWQQFWRIILPLLRPVLTLVLVLGVGIVSATAEAQILTNGGPGSASRTVGLYGYQTAFQGPMNLGYGASINLALGLLGMVISFIVFQTMRAVER